MHAPKVSMSSTYKHIITLLPSTDFVYTHLSTLLEEKPSPNKVSLNFSCYCFGACFKPYRNLKVYTFCFLDQEPNTLQVGSYIPSSKWSFSKVVLTFI